MPQLHTRCDAHHKKALCNLGFPHRKTGAGMRIPTSSGTAASANPHGSLTPADAPLIDAENLFRQPEPPHALSQWTLNAAMMQHVGQRSYPKLPGCPYGQDPESIGATHAMQVKLHMQRSVNDQRIRQEQAWW
jgi:hypothetical protein